jgi:hypothetical protein
MRPVPVLGTRRVAKIDSGRWATDGQDRLGVRVASLGFRSLKIGPWRRLHAMQPMLLILLM